MWEQLTRVYKQDNNARHFQLELVIANYSQRDLFVQYYYSNLIITKVSAEGMLAVQQVYKINQ